MVRRVGFQLQAQGPYLRAVRGGSIFLVLPDLVEVVLVQLAYKASKITVFEMFGQNGLGELLVLLSEAWLASAAHDVQVRGGLRTYLEHHKTIAFVSPSYN